MSLSTRRAASGRRPRPRAVQGAVLDFLSRLLLGFSAGLCFLLGVAWCVMLLLGRVH